MARPAGSPNKDKPFKEALRIELAALGEDDPRALRGIARNLIAIAAMPDGLPAIKEIADRLDGKPAQAIENADGEGFELIHTIRRIIVDTGHPDSTSVPAAPGAGEV